MTACDRRAPCGVLAAVCVVALAGLGAATATATAARPAAQEPALLPVRLGLVNDYARALGSRWALELEQLTRRIVSEHDIEIVIVTVAERRYGPAQGLAGKLVTDWQVGGPDADGHPGIVVVLDSRAGDFGLGLNDAASRWFLEDRFRQLFAADVDPLWSAGDLGRGFDRLVRFLAEMMGAPRLRGGLDQPSRRDASNSS